MTRKITIIFLAVLMAFAGCKKEKNGNENHMFSNKPNSGGSAGEVEVVMSESLWNSSVGDTVFYYLTIPFPGLPQAEPFYKVRYIKPGAFDGILKEHRNILIVKVDKKYPKNTIKIERDKWAYNQIVITLKSPDKQSFVKGFSKAYKRILDTLYTTELMRYQNAFSKFLNQEAVDTVKKLYGLSMIIPDSYQVFVKKKNFAWIGRETQKTTQAILIYTEPYDTPEAMDVDYFMRHRDTVLKYNVPGPEEGTYMQIEKAYTLTTQNIVTEDGHMGVLVRGLWKTHNYLMGGPFVSLTFLDAKDAKVYHLYGFVYAGKLDKKLYLWQVEAIIRSAKLVNQTAQTKAQ